MPKKADDKRPRGKHQEPEVVRIYRPDEKAVEAAIRAILGRRGDASTP